MAKQTKKVEKQIRTNRKKDVFFQIVEMRDGLISGKENLLKIIKGQDELIEYLKAEPNNRFKEVIIDLIQQNEQYKLQVKSFDEKLDKINPIIEECEKDASKKQYVSNLLSAFIKF